MKYGEEEKGSMMGCLKMCFKVMMVWSSSKEDVLMVYAC